jgi:hypothetical protein
LENKKILILSQNAQMLIPSLEKSIAEVKLPYKIDFRGSPTVGEADLILIDYQFLKDNFDAYKKVLQYQYKLGILTLLIDHIEANKILKMSQCPHIFGLSGPNTFSDIRDFIVTFFTDKKWTPVTFIPKPLKLTSKSFTTSDHMLDQINELIEGHDFGHWFDGVQDFLVQILNEAVNNSLFNAPYEEGKGYLYRSSNRKNIINSVPGKEPIVEVHTDSKKVVLFVKDFYGSIKPDEIYEYLTNGQIKEREGGAGIGMFLILKYAHKLIINIEKNVSTEVMVVIEHDKRFKYFSAKEKSFHLFFN